MLFDPHIQDSEEPVDYSSRDRATVQEGKHSYLSIGLILITLKPHVVIILCLYLLILLFVHPSIKFCHPGICSGHFHLCLWQMSSHTLLQVFPSIPNLIMTKTDQ